MSEPTTTEMPNLRVCRHWRWVYTPGAELRLGGGPAPMQLEAFDVMEALVDGEWKPVPVFEMPKPEHPGEAAKRARAERQHAAMADVFKNIEVLLPGGVKAKQRDRA